MKAVSCFAERIRAARAGYPAAAAGLRRTAFAVALIPAVARAADMNAVNHAAALASGVVVGSAVPSLGAGAVLQTLVGLAVVIGLVFGCAWLARRCGFQPARRGGALKVVASVAVGGKESATVVEIGDTWLVLGVAPGNVRLLHTLPAGSAGTMGVTAAMGTTGTMGVTGASSGTASRSVAAGALHGAGAAAGPAGGEPLPGTFGQRFRDALLSEMSKRVGRSGGKER